jgi:hypothetical protein
MPTKKRSKSQKRVARVQTPAVGAPRSFRSPEDKAAEVLRQGKLSREREKALIDAGVTKADVVRTLESRGVKLSKSSVSAVIAGTFSNADVETVFCELTRTDRGAMFPAESAA